MSDLRTTTEDTAKNAVQKPVISATAVISDLDNGLSREDIRVKYGLTKSDLNRLFKNPAIKGKKTKAAPGFVFVDDTAKPLSEQLAENVQANEETQGDSSESVEMSESVL